MLKEVAISQVSLPVSNPLMAARFFAGFGLNVTISKKSGDVYLEIVESMTTFRLFEVEAEEGEEFLFPSALITIPVANPEATALVITEKIEGAAHTSGRANHTYLELPFLLFWVELVSQADLPKNASEPWLKRMMFWRRK